MSDILLRKLDDLKKNGELNAKDAKREDNLHRFFMYPGMMVPKTQTLIVDAITNYTPQNPWVLDPFMGAGTSLLSCMEYGYNVFGQDINPFAVLLTKAKTVTYDIDLLSKSFIFIKEIIQSDKAQTIDIDFNGIDKWFNKKIQIDLSKIRRAILHVAFSEIRCFFWVVFSEVIRTSSNDRTSTFKLHQRSVENIKERNIDVINNFFELCERSLLDFKVFKKKLQSRGLIFNNKYTKEIVTVWGNSQKEIETDHKFDLLVSSPPYGDNHTTITYGQHSYLELQWIPKEDLAQNIDFDFLRTTQEIDSQSLGGRVNSKYIQEIFELSIERIPTLKKFFCKIPKEEYNKYYKTIAFINDFECCLDNIVKVMNNDAFYVWTIGNRRVAQREIPNDRILVDLMKKHGVNLYYTAERTILNKKQPRKNNFSKTMDKEKVLIFHNNK